LSQFFGVFRNWEIEKHRFRENSNGRVFDLEDILEFLYHNYNRRFLKYRLLKSGDRGEIMKLS
jgi:hypothetical protein